MELNLKPRYHIIHSFTEKDEGYVTNQVQVANDLYEALRQFFIVFKEVQSSDFYISGESYAGKSGPKNEKVSHDKGTQSFLFRKVRSCHFIQDPQDESRPTNKHNQLERPSYWRWFD